MFISFVFLILMRPPVFTRTDTLFPFTTLYRFIVSPVEELVVAVGVRNADLVLLPQFGKAPPVVQARAVGGPLVGHLRGNPQPAIGATRKADVALAPRPVAIARRILDVVGSHLSAFRALLQAHFDYARKCVGPLQCSSNVT